MSNILTERLVLSRLSEADFDELIPLYTSEEVRRYLGGAQEVKIKNHSLQICKL